MDPLITSSFEVALSASRAQPPTSLHHQKTIYAQFCAGETPSEVQRTATQLKETGYRGIVLNYAKELVFDKAAPAKQTRDDEAKDLEDWKQGLLKTVKLVESGDYAALK